MGEGGNTCLFKACMFTKSATMQYQPMLQCSDAAWNPKYDWLVHIWSNVRLKWTNQDIEWIVMLTLKHIHDSWKKFHTIKNYHNLTVVFTTFKSKKEFTWYARELTCWLGLLIVVEVVRWYWGLSFYDDDDDASLSMDVLYIYYIYGIYILYIYII